MPKLTVNGKSVDATADGGTPLLWVLREQLGPHIAREMGLMEGTESQDERDGKPVHAAKGKTKPGTWKP